MQRNKKIQIALAMVLVLSFLLSFTSFANECGEIRDEVLRLHILANSDSDEDQELKLKVRDQVLKEGSSIFDNAKDVLSAERKIENEKERLRQIALDVVRKNGYDYDVTVKISNEYFNTRTYEDVTLPAGKYNAVRVLIGSGEGKNWWCVMFPPMCLPAAESEATIDEVLSKDGVKVVKSNPKYEVRFKLVEIYESIKDKIKSK